MMRSVVWVGSCLCVLASAALLMPRAAAGPAPGNSPVILTAMQQELDRAFPAYGKSDPPLYFISYTIADEQEAEVSGSNGALMERSGDRSRRREVQTRVGSNVLCDT